MNRRRFMQTAASAAAFTTVPSRVLGANDRIGLAVLGSGNRARSVLAHFQKNSSVEVVAICDIWDEHLARTQKNLPAKVPESGDYRALLDRKDVDAVLIGTPDHWHKSMCIDACKAGKDVYVEKPLTLTPEEGPAIVKAVRENRRVMQVGMQQRSGAHYARAKAEYFDSGKLGKVTMVRTSWHGNGWHLRKPPFTDQPSGLDWKAFVGSRPMRPWDAKQFWNWRAYLDFGGGQITDLFTHWIDVVHWFMKEDLPVAAVASGGVYHYNDGRTAPDTINVLLEYPSHWTATFEATLAPGARGAAIEFMGTEGRLNITRGGYTFSPPKGEPVSLEVLEKGDPMTAAHVENFLSCMRSRELPHADVEIGHRSALASHLGNIACIKKKRIELDRRWV